MKENPSSPPVGIGVTRFGYLKGMVACIREIDKDAVFITGQDIPPGTLVGVSQEDGKLYIAAAIGTSLHASMEKYQQQHHQEEL